MAHKRSRAAFEADLQKHESPYVFYGTPLAPLDPSARDDGSFVPVWQQDVRDERGRRRLHGAFTGGFSAGYFNTVGSKEGWAPSTFVSSRSNRAKDQKPQRPEDFMDEEDLADAEESKRIQTASGYAGIGGTEHDEKRRGGLADLFRPSGDTMGVKLLQRMGWRHGQGVGPKIRRAAAGEDEQAETHLFAPTNTKMISFSKKNDRKGLGFSGETSLSLIEKDSRSNHEDGDDDDKFSYRPKPKPPVPVRKKGGFGMGILNDTGSDDEDPYEIGPRISYNRVVGGDRKKNKKSSDTSRPAAGASNPLLANKPVFVSKKALAQKSKSPNGFRKCHDGRLPLSGFVLAIRPAAIQKTYPPPSIPEGWKSKFAAKEDAPTKKAQPYQSTADAAKASALKPTDRANLLGEQQLPGKSVFDFLSPAARARLASASGRNDLPAARNEAAPPGFARSDADKAKDLRALLPDLDKETAAAALSRAHAASGGGWMPYSDDEAKKGRYVTLLELKAGVRDVMPERGRGVSTDDYLKEMAEFVQAARVFRPVGGAMASRFTSSSSTLPGATGDGDQPLLSTPAKKPEDPAEEAARMGMYGPMTRQVMDFHPTRLLCKRFNVRPPAHVRVEPGGADGGQTSATAAPISKDMMERMMRDVARSRFGGGTSDEFVSGGTAGGGEIGSTAKGENDDLAPNTLRPMPKPAVVDVETNAALEKDRPGEEIFKAIFGSDDEDEDE